MYRSNRKQFLRGEAGGATAGGPRLLLAVRNVLELLKGKRLREEPHLELDGLGFRVGLDGRDREPDEELLDLDAVEVGDGAVGELARDGLVVVDEVGELDVAGGLEMHHELAVVGERVVPGGVRDEALGEAVILEDVVHPRGRGGREV